MGLAAIAAATWGSRPNGLSPPLRGIEVQLDSPPHHSRWGCEFEARLTLPVSGMSDAWSFVGLLETPPLRNGDNVFAGRIPIQTAEQDAVMERGTRVVPDL